MRIGVLTIGDELLTGSVQDTNSQSLARILFREGVTVSMFRTCSDLTIETSVKEMLESCQMVITSGGLGPTHDDLTAESIARAVGEKLELSDTVLKDLATRYPGRLDEVEGVARIPTNSTPLMNAIGSAPGFLIEQEMGKCIISLPGVPYEMEAMAEKHLPVLVEERRVKPEGMFSRAVHFCHAREDIIAPIVSGLNMAFPKLEFGIYPKIGNVSVTFRGEAEHREAFHNETDDVIQTLYEHFPTLIYPAQHGSVIEAVLSELKRRKENIALAESCTGGEMASALTKIPGASEVFSLGVVTYSNEAKNRVLDVPNKLLESHGAVSEEVVIEMVKGLFEISRADFAIAVSGIAGPDGGTVEKPIGTVWGAIAQRGQPIFTGLIPNRRGMTRDVIIKRSTNYLYGALWRHMAYDICPFT